MCNMVAPFCRSMSYIVSYNSSENAQTKEEMFRGAIVKRKSVICKRQLDCKFNKLDRIGCAKYVLVNFKLVLKNI